MARLASTSSPEGSTWPVPLIGVVMSSFLLADWAGILTFGALPNEPETLTAAFGSEDDEPDDELPQPTRARAASSGTRSAAEMRRMKILRVRIRDIALTEIST